MYIPKDIKRELKKYIKSRVTIDDETGCWHAKTDGSRDGYARLCFN